MFRLILTYEVRTWSSDSLPTLQEERRERGGKVIPVKRTPARDALQGANKQALVWDDTACSQFA